MTYSCASAAPTLHGYKGRLYGKGTTSGQLRWILPLQMYHHKYLGFGMQYCSECLRSDNEPYFHGNGALHTILSVQNIAACCRDRCWHCGASVAFHRRELGRPMLLTAGPMSICHLCGRDLRSALPPVSFIASMPFTIRFRAIPGITLQNSALLRPYPAARRCNQKEKSSPS